MLTMWIYPTGNPTPSPAPAPTPALACPVMSCHHVMPSCHVSPSPNPSSVISSDHDPMVRDLLIPDPNPNPNPNPNPIVLTLTLQSGNEMAITPAECGMDTAATAVARLAYQIADEQTKKANDEYTTAANRTATAKYWKDINYPIYKANAQALKVAFLAKNNTLNALRDDYEASKGAFCPTCQESINKHCREDAYQSKDNFAQAPLLCPIPNLNNIPPSQTLTVTQILQILGPDGRVFNDGPEQMSNAVWYFRQA